MIVRQIRFWILSVCLAVAVSVGMAQPTVNLIETTVPNPTNDPFLNWRFIFDQPVSGVTTANFTTNAVGVAGTIASVTPSPGDQTWTVRVSGVSGMGTLGVNLSDPSGISGTTAPLTGTFVGPLYTVDTDSPEVFSIVRLDPSPTSTSTVAFQVNFSEPVFNVGAVNFTPGGSLSGIIQTPSTTDNLSWTVTISGIAGSGTIRLDLTDTINIVDAAGNSLFSDYNSGEIYVIDQDGPQLVCITRLDDNPTSASSVNFQVEFDEPALNVSSGNFVVNGSGTSGLVSNAAAEGDGTTWTVTVSGVMGEGLLTIDLFNPTGITDLYGNETTSTGPGCESYNLDRVNPEVVSIALPDSSPRPEGDSATFVVTFSEDITTATLSDFQVTGGATGTISNIVLTSDTVTVTVSNLAGPGDLCLTVVAPSTITDLIGNPLINVPVTSPCYFVCRNYGPVTILYPADGETTVTTADNIAWTHPVPDLVYDVYLDTTFLETTTYTVAAIPGPLDPGPHSYRIEIRGGCTSATVVNFNVLDRPELVFPADGYEACQAPQVFTWNPVDGATSYTLYINSVPEEVTTATFIDLGYRLTPNLYTWRVDAENEFGSQPGITRTFEVSGIDPVLPSTIKTNGTVHKILVTSSTVFVGGSFDSVLNSNNDWTTRTNLAAFDQFTGELITWSPYVNGTVYTMDRHSDRLLIGGDFTKVGTNKDRARIAALKMDFDTTEPLAIRLGANGTVRSMEVVGNLLIYGGSFDKVGADVYNFATMPQQIPSLRLAKADLSSSNSLSAINLNPNATVRDLVYSAGSIYIGGEFSQINNKPIRALARVDMPTTDTLVFNDAFDAKINLYVYSIRKLGSTLFFGGNFNNVGGKQRWNTASLHVPADPEEAPILLRWAPKVNSAVTVVDGTRDDSTIYLGGTFTSIDLNLQTYLAGVDPVMGYVATCDFNADRPVNAMVLRPTATVNPSQIFIGGLTTLTGD